MGDQLPKLVKVPRPTSQYNIKKVKKRALIGSLFDFAPVDTEIPEELRIGASEMAPLFVVDEITKAPENKKQYQKETGCKENKKSRKLSGK